MEFSHSCLALDLEMRCLHLQKACRLATLSTKITHSSSIPAASVNSECRATSSTLSTPKEARQALRAQIAKALVQPRANREKCRVGQRVGGTVVGANST